MELIDKLRKILETEYGIRSDDELLKALDEQKRADIGIFVSACGMEGLHEKAVS